MGDTETMREQSLRLLREEARRAGEEELLTNFHVDVLLCVIEEHGHRAPLSKTLESLRRCVEAREALHNLERYMDKDFFVKLVTGGFLLRSGIDLETGRVATWIRAGDFHKSGRRIPTGSPKAKAQIRAYIWFLETMAVQNIVDPDVRNACYINCNMGALDFNAKTMKDILTFTGTVFPMSSRAALSCFGMHRAVPLLWSMFCRISPEYASCTKLPECHSDVLDMVTDPMDAPESWFSEEEPSIQCRLKRTNTWCFERCLSEDKRVTTKDVFNPEPWPYAPDEEVDACAVQPLAGRGASRATDTVLHGLRSHFEEPGKKLGPILDKASKRGRTLERLCKFETIPCRSSSK